MKKTLLVVALFCLVVAGVVYFVVRDHSPAPALSIAEQEAELGPTTALSNRARVLVAPGDPARGAEQPLVTLVAFVDFRNPACRRTARTLLEAVLAYPEDVRVVLKLLPDPEDPQSLTAAKAALAAAAQGKLSRMQDLLFARQGVVDPGDLPELARRVGLDPDRFAESFNASEIAAALDANREYANRLGVDATPALFLNGLTIEDGALPFVRLRPRLEAQLREVRSLIANNDIHRQDAYATLMRNARAEPLRPRPSAAQASNGAAAAVDDAEEHEAQAAGAGSAGSSHPGK